MELIFRRIEYWIDGSQYRQKKLAEQPWNAEKIIKRVSKHAIFWLISLTISNFFLIYIIGFEQWKDAVSDAPQNNIAGIIGMLVFTTIFYFVFSWFREQVCTIVCPYGRLQGVLLDRNSIVISYDYKRGDPKGTFHKGENREELGLGDCINCTQCVQVCPAGIDIRNGTQLECINCACCIDACDSQMKAVGFKPGLIKYASEKMIAERTHFKFTIRSIAYTAVLVILLGVVSYFMLNRTEIEATMMRAAGSLYQEQPEGRISNLYNIKFINKTNDELPLELKLLSHDGEIQLIGGDIIVPGQQIGESVFFIFLNKADVTTHKIEIEVGIFSNGEMIDKAEATFVGPQK
jgi:cytochrome c oxidase accessory protein FixG